MSLLLMKAFYLGIGFFGGVVTCYTKIKLSKLKKGLNKIPFLGKK